MGNTFYLEFEPVLMQWLQDVLGEKGAGFISHFSAFGEEIIILLVLGFLYWCYDKKFGIYVATNVLLGLAINTLVKNAVLRRRPYMVHDEIECFRPLEKKADLDDIAAQGYSFPSAHSMNSVIFYGSLARYLRSRALAILTCILAFLIGISRIVVGVHYPTDVITGWALGAIIVFIIPYIKEKLGNKRRWIIHLVIFLFSSIGFFYCKTADYFTVMGAMAGFFIAIEVEEKYVKFKETSNPLEIVLRLTFGMAFYLLLNTLLKLPFSHEFLEAPIFASFFVRFIRYAIITFIMLAIYPVLFGFFNKKGARSK